MTRTLIVDDNELNCHALVRLFNLAGFEAVAEPNGWEALAILPKFNPQVIVLDIMMPGMDGLDVLASIRADPQYAQVVVLMYSALSDAGTRLRAEKMGAQGFLVKGTPFKEMRVEVERLLGISRG